MRDTATMVNGFDMSSVDALDPELRQIVKRRASLLGPAYKLFYANPVRIVRGEGVHLYDADGQAYLDAYNNVPSVGHCHPRVVEAIARQAATLNTHTRYASELILDYAERLLGTYPADVGNVMFTCTGSEGVVITGRPEILEEFGSKIRYFNTFGGNSVSIAAAAAVLDVIETEGLRQNAQAVGLYLREALEAIAKDTPRISAVRGCGLYAAADFTDPATGEPDGATAIRVVIGALMRRG